MYICVCVSVCVCMCVYVCVYVCECVPVSMADSNDAGVAAMSAANKVGFGKSDCEAKSEKKEDFVVVSPPLNPVPVLPTSSVSVLDTLPFGEVNGGGRESMFSPPSATNGEKGEGAVESISIHK